MKKLIVLFAMFFFSMNMFSQNQTLIDTEELTVKYYAGLSTISNSYFSNSGRLCSSHLRIGAMSEYRLNDHFGFNVNGMVNITKNTWFFNQSSLYFKNSWVKVETGYLADAFTIFRPQPISFDSQFEFFGSGAINTNGLAVRTKFTLSEDLKVFVSASELCNTAIGDSSRIAAQVQFKGFSIGGFIVDGETLGAAAKYKNSKMEALTYYSKEVWSGYATVNINKKADMSLAVDWIYNFNETKEFNQNDYVEVILLKFFSFDNVGNGGITGLYGLGCGYAPDPNGKMTPGINIYFGFQF